MRGKWQRVQSLAGILAVWALYAGSPPAVLEGVGVAQAGTTTGAAVTLSGVDFCMIVDREGLVDVQGQVHMVGHPAVGVQSVAKPRDALGDQRLKRLTIRIVEEDALAPVPSVWGIACRTIALQKDLRR